MSSGLSRSCAFALLTVAALSLSGCGEIGSPCTPAAGAEACPPGSFCKVATGQCELIAVGICAAIPEACTLEYAPVCGCDGETYGNACEADAQGVNVDHLGECGVDGPACGGLLGLECVEDEFCNFTDGSCGAADQTGVCEDVPEFCPEIFAPVCGCDDQTYENECFAHAEGVSVASEGACDDEIAASECGGLEGLACDEGEYCNFTDGSCGAADQLGICEVIPNGCPDNVDPVCGCDDQTYFNACEAAAAGVSVASEGECP
jgi:hypothetical protein